MILSEALDEFVAWSAAKYAPKTVVTYTNLIQRFIDYMDDGPLHDVDIRHVVGYYAYLKECGYKDSSIAYMMIAVRQFIRYFFMQRAVFLDYQLIPIPKYVSTSYRAVETGEAKEMIDSICADDFAGLRGKLMISFLYSSGVRVSELCDLRVGDLRDRHAVIISKKNRVRRMIFWDEPTHELLTKYLAQRVAYATSDYVFISLNRGTKGRGLTTRSVQRFVAQHRPNSTISAHSFRHGLGMRAVKANVHMRHIQKILGHKRINSSQIYLDVHDEDVIKAYEKIQP